MRKKILFIIAFIINLTACGGGSSSGDGDNGNINSSPTANAGTEQTVEENSEVTLAGTGTDSDGTIVSYSWSQTTGTAASLSNANTANASFIAPKISINETLTFQLTVTDDDGAIASDTISINIIDINQVPTANAGTEQTVEENSEVTLAGTGTDSDGTITSYSWLQTAGTVATVSNANTANASFTTPKISTDETLTFQLTVTDDDGNESEDYVDIKINNFFLENIMLRVVYVTEDWIPYASTDGWTNAVKAGHKQSESMKYYEVAIWEETGSIHLYAFDNDFNPSYGLSPGVTDDEKIAYREGYRLMKIEGLPDVAEYQLRSEFLKNSFIKFTNYLVNIHPNADHHLMYSGHGGPGGRLFGAQLDTGDAALFLESWALALGHNLGVVDMGGPCNKGSLADLKNFCQYADYFIASDLPNGGYRLDDWTADKHSETNPELQYHDLFLNGVNLKEVLAARIDLRRTNYEYSINNMIENKVEQANYLYACASYSDFEVAFSEFVSGKYDYSINDDLLNYLEQNNASEDIIEKFHRLIVHSVDNKDFFEWEVISNGLLMIYPDDL